MNSDARFLDASQGLPDPIVPPVEHLSQGSPIATNIYPPSRHRSVPWTADRFDFLRLVTKWREACKESGFDVLQDRINFFLQ